MIILFFALLILLIIIVLLLNLRIRNLKMQSVARNKLVKNEIFHLKEQCVHLANLVETQRNLLLEIHNLERNNLTIVASLLEMQADNIANPRGQRIIFDTIARIKSISLIHQQLYQLKNGHSGIDFRKFVESLFRQSCNYFEDYNANVELQNNVEHLELGLSTAMPLGLILNELISNSFRHSVKSMKLGIISISITKNYSGFYELVYKDNGKGIAHLSSGIDGVITKGAGIKLVERLITQLRGRMVLYLEDGSLIYSLKFKAS